MKTALDSSRWNGKLAEEYHAGGKNHSMDCIHRPGKGHLEEHADNFCTGKVVDKAIDFEEEFENTMYNVDKPEQPIPFLMNYNKASPLPQPCSS